jgi:anti-sigma factor RsiW
MTEAEHLSEMDINAYVDGELDAQELAQIEVWLAEHPLDAARVHAYKLQRLQLHMLYDLPRDTPLPPGVRDALASSGMRRWLPGWRQIAAGALLLAIGGAGGFWGDNVGRSQGEQGNQFVGRAINAYAVYAYDATRPVEIGVNDETDYLTWLSDRLGQPIRTPDLSPAGFEPIGGRLVNDRGEPAALFMYENDSGGRVTLYVRRGTGSLDTSFRTLAQQHKTALYWSDRVLDYALAGEMKEAELKIIKKTISQAIEARAST